MRSWRRKRPRRRAAFLAVALAVAAAAALAPAARAQESNQITLPPVTVTAPFVPLYLRPGNGVQAYQRNPYFGDNRVEETRFAPVPCSGFRIDPAAAAGASERTCLQGQRLVPGYLAVSKGGDRDSKHCTIDHAVTMYNLGDLSVEADVFLFDPYKLTGEGFPDPDCFVAGYTGYDEDDFRDMNQVTRRGSAWHDFRGETCKWSDLDAACETKSVEFSDGGHQCVAVRRPGPRWHGGFVWMLTASICRTDGASLQPGDAERALAAVQIRRYDPVGNLAPPPQ